MVGCDDPADGTGRGLDERGVGGRRWCRGWAVAAGATREQDEHGDHDRRRLATNRFSAHLGRAYR
jgi:hypothetical protein